MQLHIVLGPLWYSFGPGVGPLNPNNAIMDHQHGGQLPKTDILNKNLHKKHSRGRLIGTVPILKTFEHYKIFIFCKK